MILEDYCSYEVSKLLKEKGFDEYCHYFYDCETPNTGYLSNKKYGESIHNSKVYDGRNLVACPTHQMAMKWLREVHHIFIEISTSIDINGKYHFSYTILDKECKYVKLGCTNFNWKYEDAVEAALKYCLKNLI